MNLWPFMVTWNTSYNPVNSTLGLNNPSPDDLLIKLPKIIGQRMPSRSEKIISPGTERRVPIPNGSAHVPTDRSNVSYHASLGYYPVENMIRQGRSAVLYV